MKIWFRVALTAIFVVACMILAATCFAAVQIFEGTGQYIMSDFENHNIAKQRAQQRAERDAQKRAGVAIKTFSRSINSELADDEVSAVINGIIQVSDVKIVPVPFETNGEAGLMYRATLKAEIDTDGILTWLKLDSKEKAKIINQNDHLQEEIQKNDELIEDLKAKYNRAISPSEKDQIRKQMSDADRYFLGYQKVEEALKLYYAQNYNGAIKLYDEVAQIVPDNFVTYSNRGICYNELKNYEQAIRDFDKAIEINPNFAEVYVNRGNSYLGQQNYEQAIKDYGRAIEINPNFAEAYNNRGISYENIGKIDLAIQDLNKAIESNPNNPKFVGTYIHRGHCYYLIGKIDLAIKNYNKAIEINPNYEYAYKNRGLAYMGGLKRYDLAIRDFDKAIEINPNFAEAYVGRGATYAMLGNFNQAISDSTKAIEINPNLASAYQLRGLCYQSLGDNAKAQADFKRANQLGYNG